MYMDPTHINYVVRENGPIKIAVLTSGGMDSFITHEMARQRADCYPPGYIDVIQVSVRYNAPYEAREMQAMDKLYGLEHVRFIDMPLVSDALGINPEPMNAEIFARNSLLHIYGGILGDEVWSGALATDGHVYFDTMPAFTPLIETLICFQMTNKRSITRVETPLRHFTKSQAFRWALDNGVPQHKLLATTSCYDPVHEHCGKCRQCLRRWLALENNGVYQNWAAPPWASIGAEEASKLIACFDQWLEYRRSPLGIPLPKRLTPQERSLFEIHDGLHSLWNRDEPAALAVYNRHGLTEPNYNLL